MSSMVNVCWCGHDADQHFYLDDDCCDDHRGSAAQYICHACAEDDDFENDCEHQFEPDNLRFLELQSLEKDKQNRLIN